MPIYTIDTSTVIAYRIHPDNFLLSAVVLGELMFSAPDRKRLRALEALRRAHVKAGTFVCPTLDDWLTAGRVLYELSHRRRRQARGKTPALSAGESQRMWLDALLAVSTRRVDATLITVNYDDFKKIREYCPFKLKRASSHFGPPEA